MMENMNDRQREGRDCSATVRMAITAVIAVLVCISFIPPSTIFGLSLRRANILSELVTFDDDRTTESVLFAEEDIIEFGYEADAEAEAETTESEAPTAAVLPVADSATISYLWILGSKEVEDENITVGAMPQTADTARIHSELIPLEDYDTVEVSRLTLLCRKMAEGKEPVRIAFFGDSYVEGDILTSDLRALLQRRYGGAGFGFAPADSPLTAYRRTVKTKSKGWTSYNLMQYDRTPADLRRAYSVTGWISRPSEGASTRWERPDADGAVVESTEARVLFMSTEDGRIEISVNDTVSRTFDIERSAAVREVRVEHSEGIRSLTVRVLSGAGGFAGYGAVFGYAGGGVEVDNYSIRSNNGQAMLRTDPSINAQIDELLGYDLVVLQYGLNIMQQGVSDYRGYGRVVDRMVEYVRRCFPNAAILIMGVSDRSVRDASGDFVAMDAVPHLTAEQRAAARRNSAAFWSAAEAMRALGGMPAFVQNGWAGKDYTHINYAGGRRIAEMLFDAINARVAEVRSISKIDFGEDSLDSLRRTMLENNLLLPPIMDSL